MEHINFAIYLQFIISLFALVNPIGNVPLFSSVTKGLTLAEQQKINLRTSVAIVIILTVSLLLGQKILEFFSLSINSFKIAGGILVVMVSLSMVSGKMSEESQNKEEKNDFANIKDFAVVPLAIPILVGPASISSAIVYGAKYNNVVDLICLTIAVFLFGFCCWFLFKSSPYLTKVLGKTGSNVVTRIMGLILMALGVEIITNGITGLFENTFKPML